MKLLVIKEKSSHEKRVAITPDVIGKYKKFGFEIFIEKDAGIASNFSNEDFISNGATIIDNIDNIIPEIDILISVQETNLNFTKCKPNAIVIALLNPFFQLDLIEKISKFDINAFALELIPRTSRAQSMDVLSSQASISGYRAVIDSFYETSKCIPMMITSAGTISASKYLVIGAGVAGLQAIATAKRNGAIVSAFDVRSSAKEQVLSLGAKFIEVKTDEKIDGVYASEMTDDYKLKQQALLEEVIKSQDVVICTALVQGRKAPVLITEKMVNSMKPNSLIFDLAASNGGNCELTKSDQIISHNNVKIFGYSNYPSRISFESSKFFAKNILNFVELLIDKDKKLVNINYDDEIIKSSIVCANKKITNEKLIK